MRGALAGVAVAAMLASPLGEIDRAVRDRVQSARAPAFEAPMNTITRGSRVVLFAAAGVGLVAGPSGRAAVLEGVIALIPVNLAVEGLKWSVGRTRPDGDSNRRNSSFPSSHSANAWAAATVLARRWRRGWPAYVALAALVSFSRMYLDRHWLSDVAGGALLGSALAWMAITAWRRWRASRVTGAV